MNAAMLRSFREECEKIAAGPKIVHDPGLLQTGRLGVYASPSSMTPGSQNAAVAKSVGAKPGQGVVGLVPKEVIRQNIAKPERADALYKSFRRHEMTHWMRDKKGLMKGMGQPGLANVLRTYREEIAAHRSQMKPLKGVASLKEKLIGGLTGVQGSVRSAYPKGILRAAVGKVL